ncbi:Coenzyme PQQ synthesis protein D (PqqD) [Alkalitalea saponilacus]|uniref:Coenzyme PQQ synthesis protein D (PqqD) n=2 Tax=Alkalitalea saponilacus TaxID=889453 RepID=A0A1T5HTJ5_9BACT|nr:Coenzyme PQQ synthesis protein D (PqqD) [Alkalitalea saponilacus]
MDAVYRIKSDNFVTRKVGDEMVLVPLVRSVADMTRVITLNETGATILELLDGETTLNMVATKLFEAFDVEMTVLQRDLESFMTEAIEKDIIEDVAL